MPLPDTGSTLLGDLLKAFIFVLSGSYARTVPEALDLLRLFASIELVVAAIAWAFTRQLWMAHLFWKVLGFAFLAWILESWATIAAWLRDGFIQAGLLVGGNVLSLNDITDPGNIVDFGLSVTSLLMTKLSELNFLTNAFIIIFGGLGGWLTILMYMVLAAHVFKALIEYYIAAACLIFMVPFLGCSKTAPFAERVFGTFVAHALRLLIYAAILSCALPILYQYKLPNDPQLSDVGMLLAGTLTLFVLALSAPAMAHGLIMGSPVLSFSNLMYGASSALQTAAAVGAVGQAVGVAGGSALRGAVSGASAVRSAAQIGASAYRTAHPQAGGVQSSVMGGMQGMGSYAANRLTSGFRAAVQEGRARAVSNTAP